MPVLSRGRILGSSRHVGLLCFFCSVFCLLVWLCAQRVLCAEGRVRAVRPRGRLLHAFVCLFVCLFRRALHRPRALLGAVASRHLGIAACRCDRKRSSGLGQVLHRHICTVVDPARPRHGQYRPSLTEQSCSGRVILCAAVLRGGNPRGLPHRRRAARGRDDRHGLRRDAARGDPPRARKHATRGCGRGEPSPGADVGGASPVPVQMWAGEPSPGADVGGRAQTAADAGGAGPVLVQMWAG